MLRSAAVSVIANRLGQRTDLDSQIIAEMQLAQVRLEHKPELPWFLLKASSALATTATSREVTLPTDFLREDEDGTIWLTTTAGTLVKLVKDDYDKLLDSTWLDEEGQPSHFALKGGKWYMFPEPQLVYALSTFYYGKATVLSTDIENSWLANAPELLIAETGLRVARFLRDPEYVSLFQSDITEATRDLITENEARKQAAREAYMGG